MKPYVCSNFGAYSVSYPMDIRRFKAVGWWSWQFSFVKGWG